MAEQMSSALVRLTACFSAEHIEATARRTGGVQRASKMTGHMFLALGTCGLWRAAKTTRAPWAAQGTPGGEQAEVSPEALHQRRNKRALAFLQERLRQALANVPRRETVCAEGLCAYLSKVSLTESTGCGLPASLKHLLPGSGGRAAKAGAQLQAGWDYKHSVCGHFALTPGKMPEQK
jgi:hypothetical protein